MGEFNLRSRLSKIGYKFDGEALDDTKAQCFGIISSEIDKIQDEEMKALRSKKR